MDTRESRESRESREGPRSLKDLFAAAKDTSELMLDLAYAALVYNDTDQIGRAHV